MDGNNWKWEDLKDINATEEEIYGIPAVPLIGGQLA